MRAKREEEERQRQEELRRQQEEVLRRQQEEERKRREEEELARRKQEEALRRQREQEIALRRQREEEERQQQQEEALRRMEERRREEEERRKQEELLRKQEEEAAKWAREEEEAQRRLEESRLRMEEEGPGPLRFGSCLRSHPAQTRRDLPLSLPALAAWALPGFLLLPSLPTPIPTLIPTPALGGGQPEEEEAMERVKMGEGNSRGALTALQPQPPHPHDLHRMGAPGWGRRGTDEPCAGLISWAPGSCLQIVHRPALSSDL